MTKGGWRIVEVLALQLAPAEREVVLGDLIETQSDVWCGIREIVGVVVRRQAQPWESWRPWLAAPVLAFPCSLMLIGFSFAISVEFRDRVLLGARLSQSSAGSMEPVSVLCQILVLLICSWATGFTIESLSRRTFIASALCCLLPCLSCLIQFHDESLPHLCLLLFLLPAIAGSLFSRRDRTVSPRWAVALALAATIAMADLSVRRDFWMPNWELVGPVWYLAVRTIMQTRKSEGILL